jgi:hypothetical protein
MNASRLVPLAAAAILALAACEAPADNEAAPARNGSAENKAEEGQISISAPGVQLRIDVPEGLRREAAISGDDGLIYPGSRMSGVHVEGGPQRGRADGEVELRFSSGDAVALVAAWYRDPARARDFTIASSGREGEAFVFAGTTRDHGAFRIHLAPAPGGGTDGRALVSEAR